MRTMKILLKVAIAIGRQSEIHILPTIISDMYSDATSTASSVLFKNSVLSTFIPRTNLLNNRGIFNRSLLH